MRGKSLFLLKSTFIYLLQTDMLLLLYSILITLKSENFRNKEACRYARISKRGGYIFKQLYIQKLT